MNTMPASDSPKSSPTLLPALVTHKVSQGHKYVTILDAGSSGTRIYIYRYATDDDGDTIIPLELTLVDEMDSDSDPPSLHQQSDTDSAQVGNHLQPLLQFAREMLIECGATEVPIYLLATQGMRNVLNHQKSMRILTFAHEIMVAEKGEDIFEVGGRPDETTQPNRSARIISGQVEGILAWVSVNHGFRGEPTDPTFGIYEIGGASMQIAFDRQSRNPMYHVKDVCIVTGKHTIYARSWPNYGVDTVWRRVLRLVSGEEGEHDHPCLRRDQTVTVPNHIVGRGDVIYKGSASGNKWTQCLALMNQLIIRNYVPKPPFDLFYGLSKPISETIKALDRNRFRFKRILPVQYNHTDFLARSKVWCERVYQVPEDDGHEDHPDNRFYTYALQRCVSAAWISALMDNSPALYSGSNLRGNFYIPTSRELKSRTSWSMGAAALIARAQNSEHPGLKGCADHVDGLEVIGIFNGSTDGMEDDFATPADEPAFDDEFNDEVFTTTNTHLIESSDVPSSAKFIHSLSDNNFITAQFSLSFVNFALVAVLLITIGAWVSSYRRGSRRASPNIFLPGDMVKL